jgi:hypothetical protein
MTGEEIMPQVVFADPLGQSFRRVSREEIVELLATRTEEYWNSTVGAGSAQLYFCEDEDARSVSTEIALNFTMNDSAGVYIEHHCKGDDYHLLCSGELDIVANMVRIFGGQEGFRLFPRCLFVPLADATEAVSYFFMNGGRSPNVKWLPIRAISWPEIERETERIREVERKERQKKKR